MQRVVETKLELSAEHAQWIEDVRKIPSEVAAELGIVSSPNRNVVFEYRRQGKLLWVQHRIATKDEATGKVSKTYRCYAPDGRTSISEAGIALSFWNEDALTDRSDLSVPRVITEGQFDAAALVEAGVPFVASVPNGAVERMGVGEIDAADDKQFQYLWQGPDQLGRYQLFGALSQCQRVILATDNDAAGRTLREELAIRIGRPRCWHVTYPKGCKDANEVLVNHGAEAVRALIANAKPLVPDRLVSFSDIPSRADAPRYSTGWSALDQHMMIVPPQLVIITGRPNAGKSQWTLALVCNLARIHGLRGAILQFEDNPERNRRDLLRYASQTFQRAPIVGTPKEWVDRMFKTIAPSEQLGADEDFDLAWLQTVIEEAVTRHGCRWVVIDPWNEVEHLWGRQDTEASYLNRALRHLKRIARRFGIVLFIVAHPTKEGGKATTVADADLYDVNGGAVWNNKADMGVIVWADNVATTLRAIKIAKSKDFTTMGMPGIVHMEFDAAKATYVEKR